MSSKAYLTNGILYLFTPLESPAIYGGDAIDKILIPYRKGGVKASSFLTGFMIICLSLLYLTYADKWYCPATGNLREYPIPFIYSPEIGLYLSKLYKVR